jgi:formylglycine-generating enzyme
LIKKTNLPMQKTYEEGELLKDENGKALKLFGLEKTEMVFVEKGSFTMGEESNTVEINFKEGYFIGKYPVTQELYENVMGENPSELKGKHRPVGKISWANICTGENSFLAKLKEKIRIEDKFLFENGDFKLPSETQWRYAAQGGEFWNNPKLDYAGSNAIFDVAWFIGNSNNQTMPVGLKQPNILGLYDMSGNVWEWCEDCFYHDYNKIPKDGSPNLIKAIAPNDGWTRVMCGGGYSFFADRCKTTYRESSPPESNNRYDCFGFRLVFSRSTAQRYFSLAA